MLRHEPLVRPDVSEERGAIIRVTRIDELGTTLALTNNQSMSGGDMFTRNVGSYNNTA
jgi:hypothetical protein